MSSFQLAGAYLLEYIKIKWKMICKIKNIHSGEISYGVFKKEY